MDRKLFWEMIRGRADMRSALKNGVKHFFILLAAGLLIKLLVLDSVKVKGAQMEPAIMTGDRIIFVKTPYTAPVIRRFLTKIDMPVIADLPDWSASTVLRVAALSGDTVRISAGQLYRDREEIEGFGKDVESSPIVPPRYSPVDNMATYRIPAPKDSIAFAGISTRDLIFAYSVLRQERRDISLKARVVDGGKTINSYMIKDFAFYRGSVDSIPDEFHADWFFWERLQGYLDMTAPYGKKPRLAFSVFMGDKEISGFKVKKRYVFLIGDNWNNAMDSRYFGPVISTNIRGRPVLTLWGKGLRRVFKIVT